MDVPCGDLNWIKHAPLPPHIRYLGVDIVAPLIANNRKMFISEANESSSFAQFQKTFLVGDFVVDLPKTTPPVDLIFCRDALVHLTQKEVFDALRNFNNSGAHYLLTTTFTCKENKDIKTSGMWREINLQKPPYNLPPPVAIFVEGFWGVIDKSNPWWDDKSLGLWELPFKNHQFSP